MVKVSVIMPCLNVVKYIKPCMDSVINQSLSDIEILVIDAGSEDGTLEILSEYAKKDSRVHVVHSEKKSYGYQMNLGIAHAMGEYIGIVETDDVIQPDMFAVLYDEAICENADYVKGTSEGFFQKSEDIEWRFPITPCRDLGNKRVVIPKETPELSLYDSFLWNGIYRREFMQTIVFNETAGAAFQDIGALFQIVSSAKKGVYINHLVYNYRQDNSGASSYSKKSFSYVAVEYRYIEQFVKSLSSGWEEVYFLKMAGHSIDRLWFMAASGEYWEESRAGIDELCGKLRYAVKQGKINETNCSEWHNVQLFIENPYLSFLAFRDEYREKVQRLHSILETIKGHNVYIFGAGKYGMFFHMCLALVGIVVSAYCDNSGEKRKEQGQAVPIITPEEAVMKEPNAYYVVTVQKYIREITEQLIGLGVEENHIIPYDIGMDIHLLKELAKG